MCVFCFSLRLQSLLYFKLFMLKKNETVKLKKILEDHHNKVGENKSISPAHLNIADLTLKHNP